MLSSLTQNTRRAIIGLVILLCLVGAAGAFWVLPNVWQQELDEPAAVMSEASPSDEPQQEPQNAPPEQGPSAKAKEQGQPHKKKNSAFDIATIDPGGTSVFAGRAQPNGHVTVFADGKVVGTANTDAFGEWVLVTEDSVPSDDPELTVEFGAGPAADNTRIASQEATTPTKGPSSADASAKPEARPDDAGEAAEKVTAELVGNLRKLVERERVQRDDKAARPVLEKPEAIKSPALADNAAFNVAAVSTQSASQTSDAEAAQPGDVVAQAQAPGLVVKETKGQQTELKSVPVPIKFVFNEPVLTKEGREIAELLVEYVKLKNYSSLELTGHADERGRHDYNLALSSQRLQQVAAMLREAGYSGKLRLVPKGETEPFTGVDRDEYPEEVLYELDRRVELREALP